MSLNTNEKARREIAEVVLEVLHDWPEGVLRNQVVVQSGRAYNQVDSCLLRLEKQGKVRKVPINATGIVIYKLVGVEYGG